MDNAQQQDETLAEFSTLEMAMCMQCYTIKLPNLKLKTRPKQLLGSLPLDITLPIYQSTVGQIAGP